MTPSHLALVIAAGLLAGGVNAIAGGGTLISFPALLAAGLPPVTANVTSSVGLLSGYAGGIVGYRRELRGQRDRLHALAVVVGLGGISGAVLLLVTPAAYFRAVVPYLVLLSALLLLAQPRLARWVAKRTEGEGEATAATPDSGISGGVRVGVFVAAVYGAYFGAGLGVLLLAVLGILVNDSFQRLNGLKSVLSFLVNLVGVAVFVGSGRVAWSFVAVLLVSSYAGGLTGARLARRLSPTALRIAVVILGCSVAIILIVRG